MLILAGLSQPEPQPLRLMLIFDNSAIPRRITQGRALMELMKLEQRPFRPTLWPPKEEMAGFLASASFGWIGKLDYWIMTPTAARPGAPE